MASLDLTTALGDEPFIIRNETLSADVGKVRIVLLPTNIDIKVTIRPRSTAGKMLDAVVSIAEDALIAANPYKTLTADADAEIIMFRGPSTPSARKVVLASAAVAPVFEIMLERAARV